MHVLKTNFNKNPNVGLYGFATDEYCLLGSEVNAKYAEKVEDALHVPVHRLNLCGTSMVGVFCAGNNNCILLPSIVFESELKKLDKLKIKYEIIATKNTALGNNLLANDYGCVLSRSFSEAGKKEIKKALDVPVFEGTIARHNTVGAFASANNKGCVISLEVLKTEIKHIESALKVKCCVSTVNLGSPYIRSGLFANSKGFVIGDDSGPIEVNDIDESFGFLKI